MTVALGHRHLALAQSHVTCRRSVNILILQLDAAADEANDAHAYAMDAVASTYTCEWGVHSYGNYLSKGLKSLHSSIFWVLISRLLP